MKYLFFVFLSLILVPVVACGATYPATCPSEAQAIVGGIGGCPAIDCTKFATICAKCCPISAKQTVAPNPAAKAVKKVQATAKAIAPAQSTAPQISTPVLILSLILGIIFWVVVIYFVWRFFRWLFHFFKKKK